MTAVVSVEAGQALALLRDALDAVASVDLMGLPKAEVVAFARELESLTRQVPGVQAVVGQCLADRSVPAFYGYRDDAGLLAGVHRLTRSQARSRVRLAGVVCGRRTLSGEWLPPLLPFTAAAVVSGAITPARRRNCWPRTGRS